MFDLEEGHLLLAFLDADVAHVIDRGQRGPLVRSSVGTAAVIVVSWWRARPRRRALLPSLGEARRRCSPSAADQRPRRPAALAGADVDRRLLAGARAGVPRRTAAVAPGARRPGRPVPRLGDARQGTCEPALARALGDPTLDRLLAARVRYATRTSTGDRSSCPTERRPGRHARRPRRAGRGARLRRVAARGPGAARRRLRGGRDRARERAAARRAARAAGGAAASRARIVEAGDAERRRLERNLHDGAQQRLVAIALQLRLLESRVRDDPAPAEMATAASDELVRSLEELRELARGIHPAVLEHGLGPALESLAARTVPTTCRYERARAAARAGRARGLLRGRRGAHQRRQVRARERASVRAWRDGALASSRSPTTASAAPTTPAARACAGSPTASRRSTAACAWSARRRRDGRDRGAAVRVVIADDNLLVREGITALLREAGIEVAAEAATAEELLAAVDAHEPDVAIVDIRMPPTHTDEGLRAAREIRERHPDIGIVILSQHVEAASRRACCRAPRAARLPAQGPGHRRRRVRRHAAPRRARRLRARPAGRLAAARRRAATTAGGPHAARARGAPADGRGPLQPGDRRAARDHAAQRGEARLEHLHQARAAGHRQRAPARARRAPVPAA